MLVWFLKPSFTKGALTYFQFNRNSGYRGLLGRRGRGQSLERAEKGRPSRTRGEECDGARWEAQTGELGSGSEGCASLPRGRQAAGGLQEGPRRPLGHRGLVRVGTAQRTGRGATLAEGHPRGPGQEPASLPPCHPPALRGKACSLGSHSQLVAAGFLLTRRLIRRNHERSPPGPEPPRTWPNVAQPDQWRCLLTAQ